jgi:hypothetical protein
MDRAGSADSELVSIVVKDAAGSPQDFVTVIIWQNVGKEVAAITVESRIDFVGVPGRIGWCVPNERRLNELEARGVAHFRERVFGFGREDVSRDRAIPSHRPFIPNPRIPMLQCEHSRIRHLGDQRR